MENAEKIQQAKEDFGADVVEEVLTIVSMSDPDGAYSLFSDYGKEDHAECVSFIYFED